MFSSPKPPFSFLNSLAPTFSFTSSFSYSVTQILPTFSTASEHSTYSNTCNSIRLMRLLDTSLYTPGGGRPFQAKCLFQSPFYFRLSSPPPASLNPLEATLTHISAAADSKSLTETLSCFYATLTKNTGGPPSLHGLSALRVSALSFSMLPSALSSRPLSLPRYVFASLLRIRTSSRSSPNETHSPSLASHHMHAIPCGGSSKNQTIEIQNGGDCA